MSYLISMEHQVYVFAVLFALFFDFFYLTEPAKQV